MLRTILAFNLVMLSAVDSPWAYAQDTSKLVAVQEPTTDPEEYGRGVRTTEPRSPEEERQGFHLPEGLTIELVASEPDIAKPLNMAFDWKGRLWLTQTYEYPFPYNPANDPEGKGPKDSLVILEDRDGDGYREKVTKFADKLNIPIGVLPYEDGALCFDIPNIYMLRDTDGDSVCDQREVVLGPFDTTRDTHGMINAMRWMPDGWIIANHGFNNQSRVTAKDGSSVYLPSGNVFRFKPDGSSVQIYANGQVNPFGMTIDQFGNVFTADCHSKPISQVVPGGFYPSFGRPDDGLGFIPPVMDHLHGSTAICGIEIGFGSNLPAEYADQFLSGNVMTSRINRNQIVRQGFTVKAIEQPDFMTSDDPWFRPVDIRLGPDGWLYVADFYNRIIGHYEVPLLHEGRDRFRGRIWRIGRVGASSPALNLEDVAACTKALTNTNPTVVRLALQRLEELSRDKKTAAQINVPSKSAQTQVASAWARNVMQDDQVSVQAVEMARDARDVVAVHGLRMLGTTLAKMQSAQREKALLVATSALGDWQARPHAAEEAGRLLVASKDPLAAQAVLNTIVASKQVDPVLYASLRISLREMLRDGGMREQLLVGWEPSQSCGQVTPETAQAVTTEPLVPISSDAGRELFDVLVALKPEEFPGKAGFAYLEKNGLNTAIPASLLTAMAQALPAVQIPELLCVVERSSGSKPSELLNQIQLVAQVLSDSGKLTDEVRARLAASIVQWQKDFNARTRSPLHSWIAKSDGAASTTAPWNTQLRPRAEDGSQQVLVFDSITLGEPYTGVLESGGLPKIDKLSFDISGHNGDPAGPDLMKNRVELVDLNTREVLATQYPPRHDPVRRVEWDLREHQDRSLGLRVVDGDNGGAYAWIAVGNFEPAGLSPTTDRDQLNQALEVLRLIGGLPDDLAAQSMLGSNAADDYLQLKWLERSSKQPSLSAMLALWAWEHSQYALAGRVAAALRDRNALPDTNLVLQEIAQASSSADQQSLAITLSSSNRTHELLLHAVEQGWLSRQALVAIPSSWWQANEGKPVVAKLAELKPSDDETLQKKMAAFLVRRGEIAGLAGSTEAGKAIFTQQCAICHQFAGQGKVVGPQLEGVGGRGLDRLCEDILLPNQNVDHAFRTTAIMTNDGQILNGLVRQRDDEKVIIADAKGELQTISLNDIEEERHSNSSLMPENFAELLTSQQMADLIQYLRKPNN